MHFDHERLDVYRLALDFLVYADGLIRRLPRGRAHFADQLGRSALSVVLNIAEGAGKVSAADKRRYYLTARGSATEAAALLDALSRVGLLDDPKRAEGKEMLLRIVSCWSSLLATWRPQESRCQSSQTRTAATCRKARKFRASFSKRVAILLNRLMRWKKCSTRHRSRYR